MPARRLLTSSVALVLATFAGAAHAGEEEDLQGTLNETVVCGASKTAETASDAPATTITITAADIRRYGIRSLDEAIDFLGMGLVTQNPLHSVEVGGRGVLLTSDFGNHVLLVVDGHVMNEPYAGTAYFDRGAAIPIELIDHIELVLGAGSVLYGNNAMFGVVNVVTKTADKYPGAHLIGEGSLSSANASGGAFGSSYRVGAGLGEEFRLFGHRAELTGQLELYRQTGPSFEFGPQPYRNFMGGPYDFGPRSLAPGVWGGRTSGATYATTVPSAHVRLTVGEVTLMLRAASYRRSTPYMNHFNLWASDFDSDNHETDRWLQFDLQWRKRLTERFSIQVRGYGDAYDSHSLSFTSDRSGCIPTAPGGCYWRKWVGSRWLGLELQGTVDWLGDDRLTTLIGVDGRLRHVFGGFALDDLASSAELFSRLDEVTERPVAAYVQQRWTPVRWLHFNAGARADREPRGGHVSPRVAVVVDTWRGGALKFIYAEAFRAPTFYEATVQYEGQQQKTSLEPETVRSVETAIEQRWGMHRISFGAFYTLWRNMIALQSIGNGAFDYRNASHIDNYGYDAQFEGTAGDVRYGLAVTGAWTRRDDVQSLPASPSVFGNARISYDLPGSLPVVALGSTFVGRRLADRANDGGFAVTPTAPVQVNLRITIGDRLSFHRALSWSLSANYATSGLSAYVAGPVQNAQAPGAAPGAVAELAPVPRFVGFATLRYDIAP